MSRKQRGQEKTGGAGPGGGIGPLSVWVAIAVVGVVAALDWRNSSRLRADLEAKLAAVESRVASLGADLQAARAGAQPARRGPDPARAYTINTQGAPARGGSASAPVVIAEFSDFQ